MDPSTDRSGHQTGKEVCVLYGFIYCAVFVSDPYTVVFRVDVDEDIDTDDLS